MEYFAETRKLAKTLNNPRLLVKSFGTDRAKRIQARLDEFDGAQTLQQIPSDPPPRCHRLHNNLEGKFAVDVSRNFRIIFEGYDKNDRLSVIKTDIVTIQILSIEDYH
ncbi:type II toxin-antitoxin system RelE/ParE family toxin [Lentilactobacillus sunkii]|uniref:Plasmid maintenance system killer protein n=1 Tax=Lentilactobacillus sunkii DSM 19904 TaxID=1423808 RepID=A0A0R1L8U8_9LACO|nr:plasmid maintenance system killer protein [Lentilactobacillus sunkii]KRK88007.1 plasmid maintenance system killer protein [Lentilactobacillus sunkii DSM 19904]